MALISNMAICNCDYSQQVVKLLIDCANFSAIKHKNQRRKDDLATPYINHPLGVAYILTQEAAITDLIVIQAAVLHDTVEDTDTTLKEIEDHFGPEVSKVVEEVTDDKTLPKAERKQLQVVHAASRSHRAKLVILADKLYNVRDLIHNAPIDWNEIRIQEYFVWASKVINELRGTNKIMEDALDKIFEERGIHRQKKDDQLKTKMQ